MKPKFSQRKYKIIDPLNNLAVYKEFFDEHHGAVCIKLPIKMREMIYLVKTHGNNS